MLYRSNVILYDHQTESLWSQLMEKAIAGPLVEKRIRKLDSIRTSWKAWKKKHPETTVLSTDTGYKRDYSIDPYQGYYRAFGIWFPVGDVRRDLSPKEMVLGVEVEGKAKAYPLSLLRKTPGVLTDEITPGETTRIEVSPGGEVIGVSEENGKPISPVFGYWFSWQAFHPETEVYGERRQ